MQLSPKKQPQKILVTCPSCQHQQYDYPGANATYCRKCGERIMLGQMLEPLRNKASARKKTSIERRSIVCMHCKNELQVYPEAESWQCAFCSTYLDLRDHRLNKESSSSIRTYGDLEIGAKCLFNGAHAEAENIQISGRSNCKLVSRNGIVVNGDVKIYAGAEGDNLHINEFASLYAEGPMTFRTIEVHGRMEARQLSVSGKLEIHPGGHLTVNDLDAIEVVVQPGGKLLARYRAKSEKAIRASEPLNNAEDETVN